MMLTREAAVSKTEANHRLMMMMMIQQRWYSNSSCGGGPSKMGVPPSFNNNNKTTTTTSTSSTTNVRQYRYCYPNNIELFGQPTKWNNNNNNIYIDNHFNNIRATTTTTNRWMSYSCFTPTKIMLDKIVVKVPTMGDSITEVRTKVVLSMYSSYIAVINIYISD